MYTDYPKKMLDIIARHGFQISKFQIEKKKYISCILSYNIEFEIELSEKVIIQSKSPSIEEIISALDDIRDGININKKTEEIMKSYIGKKMKTQWKEGIIGKDIGYNDVKQAMFVYRTRIISLISDLWENCPRFKQNGDPYRISPNKCEKLER